MNVFHVFDQNLDDGARLGQGFAFFPFAAEDDAFALIAHIDQHDVAFHTENAALNDLVQVHFLRRPVDLLRGFAFGGRLELDLPFFFREIQRSNEVAIDHKTGVRGEG